VSEDVPSNGFEMVDVELVVVAVAVAVAKCVDSSVVESYVLLVLSIDLT